jgi:ankyrin repeat protein
LASILADLFAPRPLDAAALPPGPRLAHAARAGKLEALEAALAAGANPMEFQNGAFSALAEALLGGNAECAERLLPLSPPVSDAQGPMGQSALHAAALGRSADALRLAIGAAAKIDPRDEAGATPLLLAVQRGRLEAVELLLAAGADPKAATLAGSTPLMEAAFAAEKDLVDLLMPLSDVEAADRNGCTALMVAASASPAACEALARVARLDARDQHGANALMIAAQSEPLCVAVLAPLFSPEAVRELRNGFGHNAIDCAVHLNQAESAQILVERARTAEHGGVSLFLSKVALRNWSLAEALAHGASSEQLSWALREGSPLLAENPGLAAVVERLAIERSLAPSAAGAAGDEERLAAAEAAAALVRRL